MTKPTIGLQELRARIGQRAKSAPTHKFWGLYVHIVKRTTLEAAYLSAKRNRGAPGSDGETFERIDEAGREEFLAVLNPPRHLRENPVMPDTIEKARQVHIHDTMLAPVQRLANEPDRLVG